MSVFAAAHFAEHLLEHCYAGLQIRNPLRLGDARRWLSSRLLSLDRFDGVREDVTLLVILASARARQAGPKRTIAPVYQLLERFRDGVVVCELE